MFAVVTCLQHHDPRMVVWALVICVAAVATGLSAYRRALATTGAHRLIWIAMVACVLGSGVWATHFMAMLAFQRDMRIGFGFDLTALSLAAAIGGMGMGVAIAAANPTLLGRAAGGTICGGAISLMHFVGVAAMQLPALLFWDRGLVAAAIAISIGGSACAFAAGGAMRHWRQWAAAGLLLCAAIAGLHFTAMGAVTLMPIPATIDPGLYGRPELAFGVGALTVMIVMAAAGMAAIDRVNARATAAGLRAALSVAPSAMALFDGQERLVLWNRAYGEVLATHGLDASPGLSFQAVVAAFTAGVEAVGGPRPSLRRLVEQPAQSGFTTPDGRSYQPHIGPSHDGGFVVLLNDITERQALIDRETEARRAAEAANRAKSDFLANMSHEIRTPLNAVLGMVQIMQRSSLAPEQRRQLEIIAEGGAALLSVLSGILDLSKIEAGQFTLEQHRFDLRAVVRSLGAIYAPLAAQKDVRFETVADDEAWGEWRGDDAKLVQVLSNLLSNALKFTAQGTITLAVRRAPNGLAFEVRDTGLGIPTDKLELIFDKFTQADASTNRRFGGSGLGLAICRELVALMGGSLAVTSREGRGSVFSFTVPLAPETAPVAQSAPREPETPLGGAGLRILAAEDNPTNQLILRALLEPLDIELTMVGNGLEAVAAQASGDFDLVLMDAQMPEMNGIDAAAEIRRRERATGARRTPIIALTANVMRHQVDSYLEAGMDGVVAKPIELPVLIAAIDAALAEPTPEASVAA
jgi:signal transduction histidine kinase